MLEHAGREPEHHPNQNRCDGAVTAAAGAHWWSRLEKQTSGADRRSRPKEQNGAADRSSRPEQQTGRADRTSRPDEQRC
ncbi:unnamed protein product [Boreogadus saida]